MQGLLTSVKTPKSNKIERETIHAYKQNDGKTLELCLNPAVLDW